MKNGNMETFLCITYTHKVSDTDSLPYTKGDVRVLLHVGHVTLKRLNSVTLVSATLEDVIKTEGTDDADGFSRFVRCSRLRTLCRFFLCFVRGQRQDALVYLDCCWTKEER